MGIIKERSVFTKEMLKTDELFSFHSTFGVGGKIAYYFEPTSINQLKSAILFAKNNNIDYKIIGNGSNILCSDSGFNGLVICSKKISKISYNDKTKIIRAFTGAKLKSVVEFSKELSFGGLEPLCGIPATIGGATIMNAGAFGDNIGSFINSVCYFDGENVKTISSQDCNFGYRNSIFRENNYTILYVDFLLNKGDKKEIQDRINNYNILRKESQPKGKSCGSVFKNPVGYTAGRVIESANLKGYKIGDAVISTKHANFIINNGNAKSQDIVDLIKIIKQKVKKIFNIDLKEEVEYLGF